MVLAAIACHAYYVFIVYSLAFYGCLFPNESEAAFSNYRLWESVGIAIELIQQEELDPCKGVSWFYFPKCYIAFQRHRKKPSRSVLIYFLVSLL
jgi:hypothetical protein